MKIIERQIALSGVAKVVTPNQTRGQIVISTGGTSANNLLVVNGHGDIVDGGVYLTEASWSDNGDGTWSTPPNSFLPDSTSHASWYAYSTTGIMNASATRDRFQNQDLQVEIDTSDIICKPFVYYIPGTLSAQGDATWVSANNSIKMQSTANPCSLYGEMVVPNARYGILNMGSHVRIKNFVVVHFYKNPIRNPGVSGTFENIEVSDCLVAYGGGGWNTVNTIRAGNGITFKPNTADAMNDIRATGNQVIQQFDAGIDTQLDSTVKVQTANNCEFDNNLVTKASVGLFHGCMNALQNHAATGMVTRDNIVRDIGYGWGTYQRASDCPFGGYNQGNALTILTQKVGQTMSASVYGNSCDHYAGFKSDDTTNTVSGVATYNATGLTFVRNDSNTFTNDTGDFAAWDVAKTCFDPFIDGFPLFLSPTSPTIDVPATYVQQDLQFIHWSVPLVAYPGIDIDFKLTAYDWFNREITWSLDAAPSGMTIDSATGELTWVSLAPSQDGDHTVTARAKFGGIDDVTHTWTITSGTTNHIFCDPSLGSGGTGTLLDPYGTVTLATNAVAAGGKNAVLIRGGTFVAHALGTTASPLMSGKAFAELTQVYIGAYPGETVVFNQNDTTNGWHDYSAYVTKDKITVRNSTGNESAGILFWGTVAGKRCETTGSDWNDQFNTTGFYTAGGALLDSCTAYDNKNTGVVNTYHNSSNYLHYCDKAVVGHAFYIDCLSGDNSAGDAPVGMKIKHGDTLAGLDSFLHIHRCVIRYSDAYATACASDYSCVRHSILFSPNCAASVNVTDVGGNANGMLYQHNHHIIQANGNIPNSGGKASTGLYHDGNFVFHTETVNEGVLLQENVIVQTATPQTNGKGSLVCYGDFTASGAPNFLEDQDFQIIDNQLYAPSDANLMEDTANTMRDTAGINARTNCSGNTYEGVAPASIVITGVGGGTDLTKTSWTWTNATGTLV